MNIEIEKIQIDEVDGAKCMTITTKPILPFDKQYSIVVFDPYVIMMYEEKIAKYKALENLPIRYRMLTNVVPVQGVLCKYIIDDDAIANGDLTDAVRWAPGWSPKERNPLYRRTM